MTNADTLRYERKFVVPQSRAAGVASQILSCPGNLYERYPPRLVMSIYGDSAFDHALRDNIEGVARRRKARIRWYGQPTSGPVNAHLELKQKQGFVGWKDRYPLGDIDPGTGFQSEDWRAVVARADASAAMLAWLDGLQPVLVNCYKRTYFETRDGAVRVTIDRDLKFGPPTMMRLLPHPGSPTILEVKYRLDREAEASRVMRAIDLPLTKYSKFVAGRIGFRL